jgi:hypothetical protein
MKKIIVAVHGIGEQLRGETSRSVAYQVCRYWEVPASMPLGRFGAELIPTPAEVAKGTFTVDSGGPGRGSWSTDPVVPPGASFLVETPPDPKLKNKVRADGVVCGDVVFGEVYWADIPRGPVAHRYTLEGARKWAQAVVERVRDRDIQAGQFYSERFHYAFAQTVIGQMVEGIGVLGRLCFLAEKAGLFRFDLDDILVNYLGDVQVVTEFRNYRRQILDTFHALMRGVYKQYGSAGIEIYVVGHSEGSVIAFLAMLEALRGQTSGVGPTAGQPLDAPWAASFRGLMTIGSPIGKHLLLWPWLWQHLEHEEALPPPPGGALPWSNYYDYGDPVGFSVRQAENWLDNSGWRGQFDVKNVPFTRYPLPGKAHTDYWTDQDVFGHFLGNVVWPPAAPVPAKPGGPLPAQLPPPAVPSTRKLAWASSLISPYLLAVLVLLAGVYLLVKGVSRAHAIEQDGLDVIRDMLGVGFLLAGATTVVRVPRLTSDWFWVVGSVVLFVGSLLAFPYIVSQGLRDRLWLLLSLFPIDELPPLFGMEPATWVVLALACLVVTVVCVVGLLWPSTGVKPIVLLGSAVLFGLIGLALVPSSPFHQYVTVKEVVAEETGLDGPLLDAATSEIMRRLTDERRKVHRTGRLPESEKELRDLARPLAQGLLKEEKYEDKVRPPRVKVLPGVVVPLRENCCAARDATRAQAWPLVLMGAGFLYLWWVAALLLDLTVVWHHFIKGEAIVRRLEQTVQRHRADQEPGQPAVVPG